MTVITQALWDDLVEIERREDAGEDVWGLKAAAERNAVVRAETANRIVQEREALNEELTTLAVNPPKINRGGVTMKQQAIDLYTTLNDKSRKGVIEALVATLGMKKTTASTYAHNLRKWV